MRLTKAQREELAALFDANGPMTRSDLVALRCYGPLAPGASLCALGLAKVERVEMDYFRKKHLVLVVQITDKGREVHKQIQSKASTKGGAR